LSNSQQPNEIVTPGNIDISNLSRTQSVTLLQLLNAYDERLRYNKLEYYYSDVGPYARHLYPKHMSFFSHGNVCKERIFFGGNRTGKSTANCYEAALHMTGLYPKWWNGKRFTGPTRILLASDSFNRTRDILQEILLGPMWDLGSGMIPKNCLKGYPAKIKDSYSAKSNIPNGIESFYSKHHDENGIFDGYSKCEFAAYSQGREGFQGTQYHYIGFDEPFPEHVYTEAITRTMGTGDFPGGIISSFFTPMDSYTEVVSNFLPDSGIPEEGMIKTPGFSRYIGVVTWDDVPHLPKEERDALYASYPEHEKEARKLGIPPMGRGKIFRTPVEDITVEPFTIPRHWKQFYGFDFAIYAGHNACVWFALDEDNDTYYITDVYNSQQPIPAVHGEAIRRKGAWIPGVIDPSALKKQSESATWLDTYQSFGLNLETANNAVDAGIIKMVNMFNDGRLKVMRHCTPFFDQYRTFHYDKAGKVAKNQKDDVMDASRYGVMSGPQIGMSLQEYEESINDDGNDYDSRYDSRDSVTGY
jgi:phage terminase large subunit-like protein